MLWLHTSSGHAIYVHKVSLLYGRRPFALNLLVCLMDTLFDRCPAGLAYLLTRLLLRGCWHARRNHGSKRCQQREPDFFDRTHV
jgi:hypothetical protein